MRFLSLTFFFVGLFVFQAFPQQVAKRGSYASYGSLILEDNSFLVEEAFNQDMGVIQHITTIAFDKIYYETLQLSFTQEIPITDQTHQLSYTLLYSISPHHANASGFGDLAISYRPMLLNRDRWLMLIPRLTVIIPTGNALQGLGAGGWGLQLNTAVTKRISRKIVTHYNFGVTGYLNAKHYTTNGNGERELNHERNLLNKNLAGSLVWYASARVNLLTEYVVNFNKDIDDDGRIISAVSQIINPGLRFCFSVNNVQVVPGISVPLSIENRGVQPAVFFYLSLEPAYR